MNSQKHWLGSNKKQKLQVRKRFHPQKVMLCGKVGGRGGVAKELFSFDLSGRAYPLSIVLIRRFNS